MRDRTGHNPSLRPHGTGWGRYYCDPTHPLSGSASFAVDFVRANRMGEIISPLERVVISLRKNLEFACDPNGFGALVKVN